MMFGLSATDFKTLMRIILAHSAELERVVLFGSRARNDHQSYSDIDLAVYYNNTATAATLRNDFESSVLPYKVDLINLALEKDTTLGTFIQQEGVVLYDANLKNTGDQWMTYAVLNEKLLDFQQALIRLNEALSKNIEADSLYLDGTIQRFEFTYELCWKLMKAYLHYLGVEANNPRDAIRESLKQNIISDKDSAQWFNMIEKRNLTSHTYHKAMAMEVYSDIQSSFIHLLRNFEKIISPRVATIK